MADRISVIIPVYNVAEALPRCLDSVLAQTYPDLEIVAVDDGSTDGSGAVLDRYSSRIRVIHQQNAGVTAARLRGVAEAAGTWIGFVDGDDEIEPDMYARLWQNAQEQGADISHCGYQMVFADGRVHYFHNTGARERQNRVTALRELLSGERIEPGLCNKLFHKSLFAGLTMPTDIRINEDLLMNYYLFSAAKQTVFEDWCPYHYIVRNISASRSKLNKHKIYDPLRVKEIIVKTAPEAILPDARRAYLSTCVHSYCELLGEKELDVCQAKKDFRGRLKAHYDWRGLLPGKTRLLTAMMRYAPGLLRVAYPLYTRFLQKNQYV